MLAPDVRIVSVYRKRVECIHTYSRRTSVSWRCWMVLKIGRRLSALAISGSAFRQLRRAGVALAPGPIRLLRAVV